MSEEMTEHRYQITVERNYGKPNGYDYPARKYDRVVRAPTSASAAHFIANQLVKGKAGEKVLVSGPQGTIYRVTENGRDSEWKIIAQSL